VTMALPCLGGLAGVSLVGPLVRRFGTGRVLWWSTLLRAPWEMLGLAARPGLGGLAVTALSWTGLMAATAVYGTTQSTERVRLSPPDLRARINAASRWVGASVKPTAPVIGGLLGAWIGLRPVFALVGVAMLVPVMLLPRPGADTVPAPAAEAA
jgi:hypothetical protein